jgi:hypothetical protein
MIGGLYGSLREEGRATFSRLPVMALWNFARSAALLLRASDLLLSDNEWSDR